MLAYAGPGWSASYQHMRRQYEASQLRLAQTDDDPEARLAAEAAKLAAAHRAGQWLDIDPDYYKSYLRPRLRVSPDPAAAALVSYLDRRFGLAS